MTKAIRIGGRRQSALVGEELTTLTDDNHISRKPFDPLSAPRHLTIQRILLECAVHTILGSAYS